MIPVFRYWGPFHYWESGMCPQHMTMQCKEQSTASQVPAHLTEDRPGLSHVIFPSSKKKYHMPGPTRSEQLFHCYVYGNYFIDQILLNDMRERVPEFSSGLYMRVVNRLLFRSSEAYNSWPCGHQHLWVGAVSRQIPNPAMNVRMCSPDPCTGQMLFPWKCTSHQNETLDAQANRCWRETRQDVVPHKIVRVFYQGWLPLAWLEWVRGSWLLQLYRFQEKRIIIEFLIEYHFQKLAKIRDDFREKKGRHLTGRSFSPLTKTNR